MKPVRIWTFGAIAFLCLGGCSLYGASRETVAFHQQRANLDKDALEKVLGAYQVCSLAYAEAHKSADATPGEIADAAVSNCADHVPAIARAHATWRSSMVELSVAQNGRRASSYDVPVMYTDDFLEKVREDARGKVIDWVVRSRTPGT